MRRLTEAEAQIEIGRIVESLKVYHPQRVILYGSFARGDYHCGSDLDLIIVKETDQPFADRIGDVLRLCRSRIPIEPLVYRPSEMADMLDGGNDFLETALKEGIVLYEQQPEGGPAVARPGDPGSSGRR
jgi:predicted nucleotidyltransferase